MILNQARWQKGRRHCNVEFGGSYASRMAARPRPMIAASCDIGMVGWSLLTEGWPDWRSNSVHIGILDVEAACRVSFVSAPDAPWHLSSTPR